MSELTSNQYLIIIAVLVFMSVVMLFLLSRSKRDTQELQQDLNKTIGAIDFKKILLAVRSKVTAQAGQKGGKPQVYICHTASV